jgi:fibronectin type 3 domain-containing protein
VWATSTSWTESTITWNNGRPARSGSAALGNFGRMDVGRVSTPVSGVTTSGVKSFELAPESGDLLITSSRQDTTTTNRPQLVLTIATAGGSSAQPPAAPTNLAASAGDARVTLNWSASSGATGYDVYRASGGGSLTRVGSATPTTTATSFTDTGLTNGTQYSYAVRAINSAGQSRQLETP